MHSSRGDRVMRLLKRTSEQHQSNHLALAVALGMLAGLVPKTNLLAVFLYAAIFILPLHTLLALVVSLVVACVSGYFDPLSHAIGTKLLALNTLRPFWQKVDNTPVLPWFRLHNTVVLGSLLIGIVLLLPSYFVSFRIFESLLKPEKKPIRRVDKAEAIVPPPKVRIALQNRPKKQFAPNPVFGDEPIEFDPVDEVSDLINQWHMGDARRKVQATVGVGGPSSHPNRTEALPAADSLSLAHSANEVLAWIDEAIDQCMSHPSSGIVSQDSAHSLASHFSANQAFIAVERGSVEAADASPSPASQAEYSQAQYWMLETTTEIVRWAEDSSGNDMMTESNLKREVLDNMEANARQAENRDKNADSAVTLSERRRLEGHNASQRIQANRRKTTSYEQLVIADTKDGTVERATLPMDPHRGECLGYLLGHLRQTRDGNVT